MKSHLTNLNLARKLRRVLAVLLVASAVGCSGESRTEEARRNADPEALQLLVQAADMFESGFYQPALDMLDRAEAMEDQLADIPFLRARVLSAMRQHEEARSAYERTIVLDPEYPGVYMNLGNLEYMRGQPGPALEYYLQERGEVAETADYLVQLGRAHADLGNTDNARVAFERAIQAAPESPTAYMWRGQLMEDQGDLASAIDDSRQGLALDPDNLNYAYVLGVQLLRSEDLEGAVEMLERAAEGMPWHYAAHYNLGQALNGLGQREAGARYLARADTLLMHRQEVDKWENLLSGNADQPMLWVNYGTALTTAGRIDDAIDALTVAYSLSPQWLELQNNIANLLLMRGDTLDALDRYRGLLTVDSTLTDIWLNLGTVHALSGDFDAARNAWETALRLEPQHGDALEYLSRLPSE